VHLEDQTGHTRESQKLIVMQQNMDLFHFLYQAQISGSVTRLEIPGAVARDV